jgi:hypothetical protein
MKMKKIVFSIMLFCIGMLMINSNSYAAVAINGGDVWTQITASDAYAACYNMRNGTTSTLGSNSLEPHLTLNSDWGAVAYLTVSDYGQIDSRSTAYGASGPRVDLTKNNSPIESVWCRSTTGNASGVINFGANVTYTAATYNGVRK